MKAVTVSSIASGLTLQRAIVKLFPELPKALVLKLLRKRKVRLNSRIAREGSVKVAAGDVIEVWEPAEILAGIKKQTHEVERQPRKVPWPILYEDEYLIAIDKPTGVAVQSGTVGSRSVIDALLAAYPSCDPLERPSLVHRIDKGTSGVFLVALRRDIAHELAQQFQKREIEKEYWAVVGGVPEWDEKLAKHVFEFQGGRVIVHPAGEKIPGGVEAETKIIVKKRGAAQALLQLFPKTGRKHQLRAQLAKIGFPIVGDERYGRKKKASRLMLHAARLTFRHPCTGQSIELQSSLPAEFNKLG